MKPQAKGVRIDDWELLEYSAVPIPENPGALTLALQKGLVKTSELRDWLWQIPDDRGGRVWRAYPTRDAFADLMAQAG